MELFVIVAICLGMVSGLQINETCTTPCNKPGICVPVKACDYIRNRVREGTYEDHLYLEKSTCGSNEGKPLTCCPALLNPETCGAALIGKRIIGGEPTAMEEHPWAAQLVYNVSRNDTGSFRLVPKCGGSLINSRYVLTAAHCLDVSNRQKLVYVRFSDHNTSSSDICTTVNDEEVCRQDYGIDQVIVHSGYDKNQRNVPNDIALLKLSKDVVFSKFVSPICLPFDDAVQSMPFHDEEFTVTGWGRTEKAHRSDIQLHVTLMGQNRSVCNNIYSKAEITLTEMQLCVGGEQGKDSCKGDSGGPLLRQVGSVWYQVGVVSFGYKFCGSGGYPGIYTNVAKYLKWIEETVNESHCS